ncbi:hypothetical protein PHYPO_G00168930 [Pangasianodon hypophthalmus]|uniref:Uncharacterized protein n=1 Tax=Pangasianodon hypophthalmus TaxID=310915 RepID=A0A5N5JJV0_PANHP|nr:hypothetical protein PHYPO_G00168930 [Pangasianodon hypophthalmus]
MNMAQNYSSEVVLKDTAEAVIVPLKDGISSLNDVYEALIKADVHPITGQCSNYDYIRQQIVQAHQHLQRSEQTASSGLKSLDESLERLIQDEGKLECEMNDTKQTLDNLRTEQESNEKLLRESQGALEQARTNMNSTKQTLQDQESRKKNAEIITGVGAGLFAIPIIGWIAGSAMVIGGAVELDQAQHAVRVAEEEVRKSETEVEKHKHKVSDYESKISQTKRDISQKDGKLKQTREEIQKVKKQIKYVADFQEKVRRAVQLLGVLSGRVSVAEHQTRRFILQEPVMRVMEDVMKATEQITGNEVLCNKDMLRLIDQMKENNRCLAAICASENNTGDCY